MEITEAKIKFEMTPNEFSEMRTEMENSMSYFSKDNRDQEQKYKQMHKFLALKTKGDK